MADENSIAIIGMAARFPGAPDVDAYWRRIELGEDCISFFGPEDLEPASQPLFGQPAFVAAAGVIPDIDLFDAAYAEERTCF